jgi:hypothetical protein
MFSRIPGCLLSPIESSGLCLFLAGIVALPPHAKANIIINPTFDTSITSDGNAALIEATINQAISFYEAHITTGITVNITYKEMGGGLGESTTFFSTISYSQYLSARQSHSSGDAVDVSALTPFRLVRTIRSRALHRWT